MDLIPLSALQHYVFCPRQCALIYNEQIWSENFLTMQGAILHERVDSGGYEHRKNIRFERSVHVCSQQFGLIGVLDLLEYDIRNNVMYPVEYKHGKPKKNNCDKIQLCAQALCLEEMCGQTVSEGALWYMQTRHRLSVVFSEDLRMQTIDAISQVRILLENGTTPLAKYGKHCRSCSLETICQPILFSKDNSKSYVDNLFLEEGDECEN